MASEYKDDKPPIYLRWWMFIIYALVVLVVGMRLCTETRRITCSIAMACGASSKMASRTI